MIEAGERECLGFLQKAWTIVSAAHAPGRRLWRDAMSPEDDFPSPQGSTISTPHVKLRTSEQLKLIDLLENRDIGVLQHQIATTGGPMEEKVELCLVQGKQCKTEEEWRALIKPFMED